MISYLYWLKNCSKAYLFLRNLADNFEDNVTKTQSYTIFNNLFLSVYKRNSGNCLIFRSNIFFENLCSKETLFPHSDYFCIWNISIFVSVRWT